MLALYAKVYGISNADAYREICEALQTGDYAPKYQSYQNRQPQEIAQSVRASRQASGCGEGICGAVPFPAKLPADSQV